MSLVKPINLKTVKTQANNGSIEGYSNSCLFISIRDFLHSTTKRDLRDYKNITVHEIRKIGDYPGDNNEMFDSNKPDHLVCLNKICQKFSLTIIIYNSQYSSIVTKVGNGNNIVRILQFGVIHFELIVDF